MALNVLMADLSRYTVNGYQALLHAFMHGFIYQFKRIYMHFCVLEHMQSFSYESAQRFMRVTLSSDPFSLFFPHTDS